jgi:hypothetical protein
MEEFLRDGAARRRHRVTVHWSDGEYYQLLRACPLSQSLSAFVRQVVGQWAITHEVPLTDPPAIWYEDAEIPSLAEQEKAAPEAKEERTHYQSPKKGGSFHGTV